MQQFPDLQVKAISCERNERLLFQGVSFDLQAGEAIYIEGANGSGKTSLLRILTGLATAEQGEIYWQGKLVTKNREGYCQQLDYIGHQIGIKSGLTATENIKFATSIQGQELSIPIADALERVGLGDKQNVLVQNLSAGQQRRVSLARLLLSKKKLWILDEPFTAIDAKGVQLVEELILQHLAKAGLVIITSHQKLQLNNLPVKHLKLQICN